MSTPVGIVELGDICARWVAVNLDLFEQLGALVTAADITPGADQQLLAERCHRHAGHAELWARRAPTIPPLEFDAAVASHRGTVDPLCDAAAYRALILSVVAELRALSARVDPLLDPSTVRTVSLVLADLEPAV